MKAQQRRMGSLMIAATTTTRRGVVRGAVAMTGTVQRNVGSKLPSLLHSETQTDRIPYGNSILHSTLIPLLEILVVFHEREAFPAEESFNSLSDRRSTV